MRIHFIGIGGIGVSALARYYLLKGAEVSGYDLVSSEITDSLEKLGAKIYIEKSKGKGQKSKLKFEIKNSDLVIFSPAVPENDWQLKLAKKLKIKCQSYPEALGQLTKKHFTIAVCGSHGKSTVAAMIGLILTRAKLDPTVILGTKLKDFDSSNCRVGKSQYLVIEADEYKESFLNYWPKIIVLLNIDFDHPDYFKNLDHYILAFQKFVLHLPKNGLLIANKDDKNIKILNSKLKSQKSKLQFKIKNYYLKQPEAKKLRKILKIPGEFNVSNALAALTVARVLKIPDKISLSTLSQFKGTWRRFDTKKVKIENKKLILISDYGHHPTQVRETIKAAREKYKKKKIILVYQPHQYQRTYYLFEDFIKVFKEILSDQTIITDIYTVKGRESKKIMQKVNSKKLVKEIDRENTIYLPKEKILDFLKKNLKGGEVVIFMGAGDIYNLSLKLIRIN